MPFQNNIQDSDKTHVKSNHERNQPNVKNKSKQKICKICPKRCNKKARHEHHKKSEHGQNTNLEGQVKVKN